MRFRAPASIFLRRAQLILIFTTLVPTILLIGLGILLLLAGKGSIAIIVGILVLAFGTSVITGYILGSIFVERGANLTRIQNDFFSGVSHELRTPLTSMSMFIETLKDDRVTDEVQRKECLTIVHTELKRLDGLVGKLIELSRIESGRAAYERKVVPIRDVIEDAVTSFKAATLGEKVDLSIDAPRDLTVVGDRAALAQALGNLLTNAFKYGRAGDKKIAISASAGRNHVELAVIDNGPGVPAGERRRIFEHFERGQAAIDDGTPGSGLGLAIVRAIVQEHAGKVELRSEPGAGARFSILLPMKKLPA
jgi:two-component system phosphate regulon sensor histidine kinase PhoR